MDGSDVIYFDGIRYISTISSAKEFDFAPDYLARLCREGKIRAKQVGRRWYVDPQAIRTFLGAQEQQRAELSRKRREEFQHVATIRSAALARIPPQQSRATDHYSQSSASEFFPKIAAALFAIALVSGLALAGTSLAAEHSGSASGVASSPSNQLASAAQSAAGFLRAIASLLDPFSTNTAPAYVSANATPAAPSSANIASASTTIVYRTISEPIIERVVQAAPEPLSDATFVTQSQYQTGLSALDDSLRKFIEANTFSSAASPPLGGGESNTIAAANAINNLSGVTITNANLTASEIPALDYLPLSGGTLSGDLIIGGNATSTDLFANSFAAGSISASGTTTLSGVTLNQNCSADANGGKLTTDAFGNVVCAADQGGSGSTVAGSDTQVQFNSGGSLGASPNFTFSSSTNKLTVTNASTTNATSTSLFSVLGTFTTAIANTFNAALATITNLTATNLVAVNATTTNATSTNAFISNLSTATASTTNFTLSGSPSGFLHTSSSGVVSATSTFSAGSIFGTLAVSNGGTGATTLTGLVKGNGTSAFTAAAAGTDYVAPNTTITAGAGLSGGGDLSTNRTLSLNLSNANTWTALQQFANASTSVESAYQAFFGATATSSFSSTGALTLASPLSAGSGGTGISNPSAAGILLGSYGGGSWQQLATSSLGLLTTNVAEGTNLYFTTNRVASVIAGTTTDALAQGSSNKYYSSLLFASDLAGTTTNALAEGSNNKYYTDARVGSYLSGSSTVPHVGGSAYGDLLSWSGSAWTTRATSTLGVALSDTSGTLAVNRGGTNLTSYTPNQLLYASGLGTIAQIATSSLGLLTSDVAEGSNLYWTATRFDTRLSATTTLPNITTLANLASIGTITSGAWNGSIVGVPYGGTGWSTITSGTVLLGNGATAVATTTRNNLLVGSNLSISGGSNALLGADATISLGSNVVTSVVNDTNVTGAIASNALTLGWTGTLGVARGGTASSTLSGILKGNGTSAVQTAVGGTDYEFPLTFSTGLNRSVNTITNTGVLSVAGTANQIAANTVSGAVTLSLPNLVSLTNATSSQLSVLTKAYFGGSATTTIDSAGNVAVAGTLGVTGNTTLANATTTNLFSTTASSTNLFAQTAALGSLTANSLALTSALPISSGGSNASSFTTGQLLSFNGTSFVSTSTIGNNQLASSALTVSAGSGLSGGGSVSLGGSTSLSLNLANPNSWTGLQSFANASTTLETDSTLWLPNVANAILSTNANGQVVATSSIGVNYLIGTLGVGNGGTGASSFTSGTVLLGNGAGALNTVARGTLTETGSSILTITGGSNALLGSGTSIQVAQGSGSTNGFLASADWTTFNNKASTASPTFTGSASFANINVTGTASTTLFSSYGPAYFGATATSSFGTDGSLTLAGDLTANGNTTLQNFTGANATTSFLFVKSALTASAFSSPNATIGALTATSTLAVSNTASFFGTASFGGTATSSFSTAGVLTLSSALAVSSGGTGSTTLSGLLKGNGSSQIATAIAGTDYVAPGTTIAAGAGLTGGGDLSANRTLAIDFTRANVWTGLQQFSNASTTLATLTTLWTPGFVSTLLGTDANGKVQSTTIGTGLSLSGGTLSNSGVTSNVAGTGISVSGATGAVTITNTGVLSLGSGFATTTGTTITFSTSTVTTNGQTLGLTVAPSAGSLLFAPTISGTLDNTGLTHPSLTVNGTSISLGSSGTITAASSTLLADNNTFSGTNSFSSTITGNISGNAGTVTNGVYTTTFGGLFDTRLSATSTLPSITTLANLATVGTITSGVWNATKIGLAYGGTNADLSATGGTSQVLRQSSSGAAITVSQLAAADLSNGTTGSNAVVLAASPTLTGKATLAAASSTDFTASNSLYTPITSALLLADANKLTTAYTGSGACSNQFVRSLNGTGVATCASVSNSDFTGQLSAAHGGTGIDSSGSSGIAVIDSGVWSASSTLATYRGGTGAATLASNGVLYGNGAGAVQALAVNSTATNKFLTQSSSGTPAWNTIAAADLPGSFNGFANPSATIGLTAVNGSAATAMRSDAAPALSQAITPTWTGTHTFSNGTYSALFTGGNVGIGTTGPTQKLQIVGAGLLTNGGVDENLYFDSTSNFVGRSISTGDIWLNAQGSQNLQFGIAGASKVTITGSGNVGIGTTTPNSLLNVISSTGAGNQQIASFGLAPGVNAHAYMELISGNGSTRFATQFRTANNGQFDITTNATPGTFGTSRLSIDTSGNVGIGATPSGVYTGVVATPLQTLSESDSATVVGNSAGPLVLANANGATSTMSTVIFANKTSGGNLESNAEIGAQFVASNAFGASGNVYPASDLFFATGGSGGTVNQGPQERMRITSAGNVGIGTTGPGNKLEVYGTSAAPSLSSYAGLANVHGSVGTELEFGSDSASPFGMWMQASNHFGTAYPLNLNPLGGNVGIGTTGPGYALDVNEGTVANGGIQVSGTGGGDMGLHVNDTGTGGNNWFVDSTNNSSGYGGGKLNFVTAIGGTSVLTMQNNGNVGIGTTGPTSQYLQVGPGSLVTSNENIGIPFAPLSNNGIMIQATTANTGNAVIFENSSGSSVGSINMTTSATAYNTSSDRRLKENIATTTAGLSTLLQIPVDDFDFISDPTHAQTQGFIAQDLEKLYPYAVTTNGDNGTTPLGASSTPWSVDYGRITPLIVQAVQDIANITSTFQQNLIAWLGNASNGITDFFAANGHFSNELCVGSTCVTPAQFEAMVAAANQSPSGDSSSSGQSSDASTTPDTPPVIQINGDNPAHINVGDSYADLGATITGPQADLNLGYKTFLNGQLVSNIVIDTSAEATDTIDYVATDSSGNAATSTRIVIINSPVQVDTASTTTQW